MSDIKFNHPLTVLWLSRLKTNEHLTVQDLYPYSKISLKRKRLRKKFNKDYARYISDIIRETYWGCLLAHPLIHTFKSMNSLEVLNIQPMEDMDMPDIKLQYLDFKK